MLGLFSAYLIEACVHFKRVHVYVLLNGDRQTLSGVASTCKLHNAACKLHNAACKLHNAQQTTSSEGEVSYIAGRSFSDRLLLQSSDIIPVLLAMYVP